MDDPHKPKTKMISEFERGTGPKKERACFVAWPVNQMQLLSVFPMMPC